MYIDIADAMQRDAVTTDETDYSKVSMYRPKQRKAPSLLDTAQHSIPNEQKQKPIKKNSEGGIFMLLRKRHDFVRKISSLSFSHVGV